MPKTPDADWFDQPPDPEAAGRSARTQHRWPEGEFLLIRTRRRLASLAITRLAQQFLRTDRLGYRPCWRHLFGSFGQLHRP